MKKKLKASRGVQRMEDTAHRMFSSIPGGSVLGNSPNSVRRPPTPTNSFADEPTLLRDGDIVAVCRDLAGMVRFGEKSPQFARLVIQRVFKNPYFSLCDIQPQQFGSSDDHPFNAVSDLVNAKSVFFETVLEAEESLSSELWDAVLLQCETATSPEVAANSILLQTVAMYVTRMLPTEDPSPATVLVPSSHQTQRIRTPLQLLRPSSSLLSQFKLGAEDRTQILSTASCVLQPRHVSMFCNLVAKACTTDQFATPNRLLMLRYLLKQFHIFCLYESADSEVNAVKQSVMVNPPFAGQLYAFLYFSIDQCPTVSFFKDIVGCWLTYARPWRYLDDIPSNEVIPHGRFMPFAKQNIEFFRILLGKILKKHVEFEVCSETLTTTRALAEFAWREPQALILRQLGLNVQPHVNVLLEELQRASIRLKYEIEKIQNRSFLSTFFTHSEDLTKPQKTVKQIEEILQESDKFVGTKFLRDVTASDVDAERSLLNTTYRSTLDDTPKSGLLPDHIVDPKTNLMVLTQLGRKQVIAGERRFDFAKCPKKSHWQTGEIGPLAEWLDSVATRLSRVPLVKFLASSYSQPHGPAGMLARCVMYPPVPNRRPEATSPVYAPRLRVLPPTLKLRALATPQRLVVLTCFLLTIFFGRSFAVFVVIIAVIYLTAIALYNLCSEL